jgi:hypothetical protein
MCLAMGLVCLTPAGSEQIQNADQVIGASRGAVRLKGTRIATCKHSHAAKVVAPGGSGLDQRNGIVRTKVANSTPGFCLPMPAFDMW